MARRRFGRSARYAADLQASNVKSSSVRRAFGRSAAPSS